MLSGIRLEDFGKVKSIAFQAASSGSYLYPIKVGVSDKKHPASMR